MGPLVGQTLLLSYNVKSISSTNFKSPVYRITKYHESRIWNSLLGTPGEKARTTSRPRKTLNVYNPTLIVELD